MDTIKTINKKELNDIIDRYSELKAQINELEKEAKPLNNKIKNYLIEKNLKDFTTKNNNKVSISISEKKSYIEFETIDKLKKLNLNHIIKVKEYIDMDLFERELYNSPNLEKEFESCTQIDTTYKLNVKRGQNEDN